MHTHRLRLVCSVDLRCICIGSLYCRRDHAPCELNSFRKHLACTLPDQCPHYRPQEECNGMQLHPLREQCGILDLCSSTSIATASSGAKVSNSYLEDFSRVHRYYEPLTAGAGQILFWESWHRPPFACPVTFPNLRRGGVYHKKMEKWRDLSVRPRLIRSHTRLLFATLARSWVRLADASGDCDPASIRWKRCARSIGSAV
jgi:hypothetical protein